MSGRKKGTLRRLLFALLGLFLAASAAAPFLRADRFRERVRRALEETLGRKVEIAGPLRFQLLTGAGITAGDVVLHEDPAIGSEPVAYVATLDARIRWSGLLRGRVEFSTLRLVEPSVNLARSAGGVWNFLPLVERAVLRARGGPSAPPEIQVRAGRFNVRYGEMKSIFYLSAADLDVTPVARQPRAIDVRFNGEASRTDRPAQGYGRLRGRGRLRFHEAGESSIDLDLQLERSALAGILVLLEGREPAIEGFIASRARLAGPVSNVEISGRLQLEELGSGTLLGGGTRGGALDYRGRLDLIGQRLALETGSGAELPVDVRLRASQVLEQPRWATTVTLRQAPIEPLVELARHTGYGLPEGVVARGKVTGVIGYGPPAGVQGQVRVEEGSVSVGGETRWQIDEARVVVANDRIEVSPAVVRGEMEQQARVEARYAPRRLELRVGTAGWSVSRFLADWSRVPGGAPVPFLNICRDGTWKGALRYLREADGAGAWTGEIQVEDTQLAIAGVTEPLRLARAAVSLKGRRVDVKGISARAGPLAITGDYSWEPDSPRPHVARLATPELDLAALEKLLLATLRRPQGFLARTLGLAPSPLPEWFGQRRLAGTIQAAVVRAGDVELRGLRGRLTWNGASIDLEGVESRLEEAVVTGRASVDLRRSEPAYHARFHVRNAAWKGGRIDADGQFGTSGSGVAALERLRAEGSFEGNSIEASPDNPWRSVSGCYELRWTRGGPRLVLIGVQAAIGSETWLGNGATSADGRLQLELSHGQKLMRLAGRLAPFQLEPVPAAGLR